MSQEKIGWGTDFPAYTPAAPAVLVVSASDKQVSWAERTQVKTKIADQSVTSSATLVSDTHLSVSVLAAGTYAFRARLHASVGATGGLKYSLGGTATMTDIRASAIVVDTATLTALAAAAVIDALADDLTVAGATSYVVEIEGGFTVNAAGTFNIQFAQAVSDATASTLLRGSSLVVSPVTA